jgi:short-subunit dehydrogenase
VLERAAGGATVVNVLSLTSLASFPALGGYSASKAAAYSVTQALRPELKAKHIDLLAVLPGPIDTEMVKALPMPKTSPADTAKGVLAGIARGEEEIFPDPMAQQMGALWNRSHKEFERAFASF